MPAATKQLTIEVVARDKATEVMGRVRQVLHAIVAPIQAVAKAAEDQANNVTGFINRINAFFGRVDQFWQSFAHLGTAVSELREHILGLLSKISLVAGVIVGARAAMSTFFTSLTGGVGLVGAFSLAWATFRERLAQGGGVFTSIREGLRALWAQFQQGPGIISAFSQGVGAMRQEVTAAIAPFGVLIGIAGKFAEALGDRMVAASSAWTRSAIAAEGTLVRLDAALREYQRETSIAVGSTNEWGGFLKDLSLKMGIADAELQRGATSLLLYARTGKLTQDQLEGLVVIAANLAKALGVDFQTAIMQVTRGLMGQTGRRSMLSQVGIDMRDAKVAAREYGNASAQTFQNLAEGEKIWLRTNYLLKEQGAVAKLAAASMETLGGRMSQVDVAVHQFYENLGQGSKKVLEPFVRLMAFITVAVGKLPPALMGAAGAAVAATGTFLSFVGSIAKWGGAIVAVVAGAQLLSEALRALNLTGFAAQTVTLVASLTNVSNATGLLGVAFRKGVLPIFNMLGGALGAVVAALASPTKLILGLRVAFSALGATLSGVILPALAAAAGAVGAFLVAWGPTIALAAAIIAAFAAVAVGLYKAIKAISDVTGATAAFSAGWKMVKDGLSSVGSAVGNFVSGAWAGLKKAFDVVTDAIAKGFLAALRIVGPIVVTVSNVIMAFGRFVFDLVKAFADATGATKLVSAAWELLGGVVNTLWGWLKQAWDAVKGLGAGLAWIAGTVAKATAAALEKVGNVVIWIAQKFDSFVRGVAALAKAAGLGGTAEALERLATNLEGAVGAGQDFANAMDLAGLRVDEVTAAAERLKKQEREAAELAAKAAKTRVKEPRELELEKQAVTAAMERAKAEGDAAKYRELAYKALKDEMQSDLRSRDVKGALRNTEDARRVFAERRLAIEREAMGIAQQHLQQVSGAELANAEAALTVAQNRLAVEQQAFAAGAKNGAAVKAAAQAAFEAETAVLGVKAKQAAANLAIVEGTKGVTKEQIAAARAAANAAGAALANRVNTAVDIARQVDTTMAELAAAERERAASLHQQKAEYLQVELDRLKEQYDLGKADRDQVLAKARELQDQLRANVLEREKLADAAFREAVAATQATKAVQDAIIAGEVQGTEQVERLRRALQLAQQDVKNIALAVPDIVGKLSQELQRGVMHTGPWIRDSLSQVFDGMVAGTLKWQDTLKSVVTSFGKRIFDKILEDKERYFDLEWDVNFLKDIPGSVQGGLEKARGFFGSFFTSMGKDSGAAAQAVAAPLSGAMQAAVFDLGDVLRAETKANVDDVAKNVAAFYRVNVDELKQSFAATEQAATASTQTAAHATTYLAETNVAAAQTSQSAWGGFFGFLLQMAMTVIGQIISLFGGLVQSIVGVLGGIGNAIGGLFSGGGGEGEGSTGVFGRIIGTVQDVFGAGGFIMKAFDTIGGLVSGSDSMIGNAVKGVFGEGGAIGNFFGGIKNYFTTGALGSVWNKLTSLVGVIGGGFATFQGVMSLFSKKSTALQRVFGAGEALVGFTSLFRGLQTVLPQFGSWVQGIHTAAFAKDFVGPLMESGQIGTTSIGATQFIKDLFSSEGAGKLLGGLSTIGEGIGKIFNQILKLVPVVNIVAGLVGVSFGIKKAVESRSDLGKAAGATEAAGGGVLAAAGILALIGVKVWPLLIIAAILAIVGAILNALDKPDIKRMLTEGFAKRLGTILNKAVSVEGQAALPRRLQTLGPAVDILSGAMVGAYGGPALKRVSIVEDFRRILTGALSGDSLERAQRNVKKVVTGFFGDVLTVFRDFNTFLVAAKRAGLRPERLTERQLMRERRGVETLGNLFPVAGVNVGTVFSRYIAPGGRIQVPLAVAEVRKEVLTAIHEGAQWSKKELRQYGDPFLMAVKKLDEKVPPEVDVIALALAVAADGVRVGAAKLIRELNRAVALQKTLIERGLPELAPAEATEIVKGVKQPGYGVARQRWQDVSATVPALQMLRQWLAQTTLQARGYGTLGAGLQAQTQFKAASLSLNETFDNIGKHEKNLRKAMAAGDDAWAKKIRERLKEDRKNIEEYTKAAIDAVKAWGDAVLGLVQQLHDLLTQTEDFNLQWTETIDGLRKATDTAVIYDDAIAAATDRLLDMSTAAGRFEQITRIMDLLQRQAQAAIQDIQEEADAQKEVLQARLDAIDDELEAVQGLAGLLDSVRQQMADLRIGIAGPGVSGLRQTQVEIARQQGLFRSGTPEQRTAAAQEIQRLSTTAVDMARETFGPASQEFRTVQRQQLGNLAEIEAVAAAAAKKQETLLEEQKVIQGNIEQIDRDTQSKINDINLALADQLDFWKTLALVQLGKQAVDLRNQLKELFPGLTEDQISLMIEDPARAQLEVQKEMASRLEDIYAVLEWSAKHGGNMEGYVAPSERRRQEAAAFAGRVAKAGIAPETMATVTGGLGVSEEQFVSAAEGDAAARAAVIAAVKTALRNYATQFNQAGLTSEQVDALAQGVLDVSVAITAALSQLRIEAGAMFGALAQFRQDSAGSYDAATKRAMLAADLFVALRNVPRAQEGALVLRDSLVRAGERGPEPIIPLRDPRALRMVGQAIGPHVTQEEPPMVVNLNLQMRPAKGEPMARAQLWGRTAINAAEAELHRSMRFGVAGRAARRRKVG